MTRTLQPLRISALLFIALAASTAFASAQDASSSDQVTPERLVDDQLAISGRYDRFERLLSQMADILGHDDPERAELLRRAVSKGREEQISPEIVQIAELLGQGSFGSASEKQQEVTASLTVLLKLLQSEDRRSAVEKERERLNDILRDVQNTIAQQRSARARAQNSTAPSNAAPDQQKALDSNERTLEGIREHDAQQQREEAGKGENAGDDSGDEPKGEPQDGKTESGDSKPKDGEQNGADPKEGEQESSEGSTPKEGSDPQQSDSEQQPSKGQQSDGQPSEGQQSQSQQQSQGQSGQDQADPNQQPPKQQQTPGREQLEKASQLMQQALEQLKQQERKNAVDQQEEALEQLHKAIEELEEQLRQLREEEKEMVLAALEARFQRMLAVQTQILDGTLDLSATPKEQWLDNLFSRARELSQQQNELAVDCGQTAGLLREDGTSVSILLAVEDIEIDMLSVGERLQDSKVDELTQTLQNDVIEALKELIEATQREMQEMKSEDRKQQNQQQSSQEKPPLVELIAEIRVLRSLQLRVNRRTKQVDRLLQSANSDDVADLHGQLSELSERQQRLKESAAELADRVEAAQRKGR